MDSPDEILLIEQIPQLLAILYLHYLSNKGEYTIFLDLKTVHDYKIPFSFNWCLKYHFLFVLIIFAGLELISNCETQKVLFLVVFHTLLEGLLESVFEYVLGSRFVGSTKRELIVVRFTKVFVAFIDKWIEKIDWHVIEVHWYLVDTV